MRHDAELNRVRWRCRRGMLELDIALHAFVDRYYSSLSQDERLVFDRFLQQPDEQLHAWMQGQGGVPENEFTQLINKIR